MSSEFWLKNPKVLLDDYLIFFPHKDLSIIENLNAIIRFSIYTSLVLSLYHRNTNYMILSLISFVITYIIYYTLDLFDSDIRLNKYGIDTSLLEKENYTLPTLNNPVMNVQVTDYNTKNRINKGAYPINDNSVEAHYVKKDMQSKLNRGVFRDVSDIYNNKHSQRQFMPMPNTNVPNDMNKFRDFLFKDMPESCKENRFNCMRFDDPRRNTSGLNKIKNNDLNINLR